MEAMWFKGSRFFFKSVVLKLGGITSTSLGGKNGAAGALELVV